MQQIYRSIMFIKEQLKMLGGKCHIRCSAEDC